MSKKEICLGIDLGFRYIKFVELYKENEDVYLKDFAVAHTSFNTEETEEERVRAVSRIIDTAIRDKKFNTRNVILTLSNPLVFTRFIKVPISDNKKIAQMISYEAMQQVPFPLEEVVWDYQIMKSDMGEAEALLVAVKTDLIIQQIKDISNSIPSADTIDIGPLSFANMLYQSEDLEKEPGCVAVLNFGAKSSYITVVSKDIFWLRVLPVGGDDVTTAIQKAFDIDFETSEEYKHKGKISVGEEKSAESEFNKRLNEQITAVYSKIIFECKRSLNFFKTQYPAEKISSLYVTGGGSRILNIEEYIKKNFAGMALKTLNPFARVLISDMVDKTGLGDSIHLLGEAAGAALRGLNKGKMSINLMPKEITSAQMRKKNFKYYAATLAFLILIFISKFAFNTKVSSIYQTRVEQYNIRLNNIQILKNEYESEVKKNSNLMADLNSYRFLYGKRSSWLRLINDLSGLRSESLWLTSIQNVKSLGGDNAGEQAVSEGAGGDLSSSKVDEEKFLNPERKRYIIIEGETSSEFQAIDNFLGKLKDVPLLVPGSIKLLNAKAPVDQIRAFTVGAELKNE